MDTDGLSAVEELEAMQKHEKCVSSRKETVEHFTLYITLHHFTSLYITLHFVSRGRKSGALVMRR